MKIEISVFNDYGNLVLQESFIPEIGTELTDYTYIANLMPGFGYAVDDIILRDLIVTVSGKKIT